MEDPRQFFECEQCAVEYSIQTDMDVDPEFCPFCGEPLDEVDFDTLEDKGQLSFLDECDGMCGV